MKQNMRGGKKCLKKVWEEDVEGEREGPIF